MAYFTVDELRSILMSGPIQTSVYDAHIAGIADEVSEAVDAYCNRSFEVPTTATVRYYRPDRYGTQIAGLDDIANDTDLVIATDTSLDGTYATTLTGNDYVLTRNNRTGVITRISGSFPVNPARPETIKVTARFGWPTVPGPVKRAALLWAVRLFNRKDSASGVIGFGDFGAVRVSAMDPDVALLLAPFRDLSRSIG